MANKAYSAKIIESSRELSVSDRIKFKDTSDAVKLDELTENGSVVIHPIAYFIISIHNEKSENADYTKYLIEDADGTKYVTGSPSFWNNFQDIWEELHDEGVTEFALSVYKRDSANYKGKQFLTCSLA